MLKLMIVILLPAEVLNQFFEVPGLLSVVVVGSFARGDFDAYSDLDVHVIVEGGCPPDRFERLESGVLSGRRLSVNFIDRPHQERIFVQPEAALWNILPMRQARISHDPQGFYADLQARAHTFTWAQVAQAASPIISRQLAELSEEVYKLLGGLERGDTGRAVYAALGLVWGLTKVSALANGALIPTENRYFSTVRAAEPDAGWGELLWQSLGMNDEPLNLRLRSAAHLYARSVELYAAHLRPADAALAFETAELVRLALA